MKFSIDQEFIEGFHKPLFGKRRHHIDLISIGIVAEDGREYFAISNEYRYKHANTWVQDHVIQPLYLRTVHGDSRNFSFAHNFHYHYGKSNKQIAMEVLEFVHYDFIERWKRDTEYIKCSFKDWIETFHEFMIPNENHEFYGYYSDYDWVLFCSLFGTMMDLPKGFPMYCRDLKQTLDEKAEIFSLVGFEMQDEHQRQVNPEVYLNAIKKMEGYPQPSGIEHDALEDARWIMRLYNFLTQSQ